MAADPLMWKAFLEWCDRQIAERRAELGPLESGKVRMGRRGLDTDGEWIDTTEAEITRIKNEIASLESVVARNKHHAE